MRAPTNMILAAAGASLLWAGLSFGNAALAATGFSVEIAGDARYIVHGGGPDKEVQVANGDLKVLAAAVNNAAAKANHGTLLISAKDDTNYQSLINVLAAASDITVNELRVATRTHHIAIRLTPADGGAFLIHVVIAPNNTYSVAVDAFPEVLHGIPALRNSLAAAHKLHGPLAASIECDRATSMAAFSDAVTAMQANGVTRYTFVTQGNGAPTQARADRQ